jgi:hypothetical protein
MGSIDHIDIISAIAYSQSGTLIFSHEPNHILLLFGGDPTTYDGFAL